MYGYRYISFCFSKNWPTGTPIKNPYAPLPFEKP